MYWTINSLPELAHLSTRERRSLVRRAAPFSTRVRMVVRPVLLGMVVAALLPAAVLALFGLRAGAPVVAAVSLPLWAATSVMFHAIQLRAIRGQIRDQVRTLMPGQRSPVCFHCGFDLRGAKADACPECGRTMILGERRSA